MSGKDLKRKRGRPPKSELAKNFQVEVARELVAEIRQQTGCSQAQLDYRYGFPEGTTRDIVTGKRPMSDQKLKLLLDAYVRDNDVSTELKLVTARIPKRAAIERLMAIEKQLYEQDAEVRKRNFELEERKLRMELEEKICKLERLLQQ